VNQLQLAEAGATNSKTLAQTSEPDIQYFRQRVNEMGQSKGLGRSFAVRKTLFLICVFGIPCASWAQTDQASWANLSALRPGEKIQIVEMTSNKHSGTFVSVSETAILYMESKGEQSSQKQDIRSVKLTENKRRLRNTLIGAAVGAGVGAGIGAATSCSSDPCFFGRALGTAVGAVIVSLPGAAVGALLPTHNTIYRVNSH
jgi:hypothetical protein